MKKKLYSGIALFSVVLLTACGGSEKKEEAIQEPEKTCFYSYNEGSTVMEWAAYKFTEKKAVKGTFTDIEVAGTMESDDPVALLKSLVITMKTSSVESQDADRNKKIVEHFFGTIGADVLVGSIANLNDDGTADLKIKVGKTEGMLNGKYTWENNVFTFDAAMDVAKWNAMSGIEALNKICKDLHTGTDGVSKLWSEVGIHFETTLSSDCE
ncbi:MAG: hypothetical protein KJ941_11825 [Bacteroidetes bacterium]|nr:hypothetical protein [Bacteroidota bacterium]